MNGENRPIGPAPLPDNTPPVPPGGSSSPPPPPSSPSAGGPPVGPAPTGASGPPPPPPPQIDIRTMASDVESLERSGGLGTEPKTFSPADLAKEPVFTSEITSPAGAVKAGMSGKKLGLAAGAVAVLALAAAVGYFFVWPLLSPGGEPQETATAPSPILPAETLVAPPAPSHQSYFAEPPAGSKQATLGGLTVADLSGSLKATPEESSSAGRIVEVILNTDSNTSVTSGQLLGLLLPGSGLEADFESDVTIFAYYASGKSYPGYVFKLKSDADLTAAKEAAASIEKSANLTTFYPESPGTPKDSWKSGNVSGVNSRYQTYSSAGASLNYGWVNNYLVISTSFEGFKKAIELLPR